MADSYPTQPLRGFSRTQGAHACRVLRIERFSEIASIVARARDSGQALSLRGCGLSYGDSSFHRHALVLDLSRLNRFHEIDRATGRVRIEPGVNFRDLFQVMGPHGWGPGVTPGLSDVTVGGALAFDVHGKNHRRAGGFSRSVRSFDLRTADGERVSITRETEPELFTATVGGAGLTGVIERMELQLYPLTSARVKVHSEAVVGVDSAIKALEARAEMNSVVYWGDLLNARRSGRTLGVVLATEPDSNAPAFNPEEWAAPVKRPPLHLIAPAYNSLSMRLFNKLFGWRATHGGESKSVGERTSRFPWDGMATWNRLYGAPGFFEYQFVVPASTAVGIVSEVADRTIKSDADCYLFAMKLMSEGEGLLSYGLRDGVSILMDFPATRQAASLLASFDAIIASAGGRIHLAKDSRMTAAAASAIYSDALDSFRGTLARIDPANMFTNAMADRLALRDEST